MASPTKTEISSGHEADHSSLKSAKVKTLWSYTFTFSHFYNAVLNSIKAGTTYLLTNLLATPNTAPV
jgi:hypothetical protein